MSLEVGKYETLFSDVLCICFKLLNTCSAFEVILGRKKWRLGITDLHNDMILFTLSISSRGFALNFPKRPHSNDHSLN